MTKILFQILDSDTKYQTFWTFPFGKSYFCGAEQHQHVAFVATKPHIHKWKQITSVNEEIDDSCAHGDATDIDDNTEEEW